MNKTERQLLKTLNNQLNKPLSEQDNITWEDFGYMVQKEHIDKLGFYNSNLSSIPSEIFSLKLLRLLSFVNTEIDHLPDQIDKLTNLEELYLGGTRLSELPKSIGKLSKLRYLYVYEDNIKILPKEITNCKNLKELATLKETTIPEEVQNLKNQGVKIVQI